MNTVAIVGAGDIGGAVAQALAASDIAGRVLLIDSSGNVAAGKALDIQQMGAVSGFHTRLEGSDDFTRVIGCTLCIIADRFGAPSGEWSGDAGLAMLARLVPSLSSAPLVFAGSDHVPLMELAARELGFARTRLLGSAPEAFASAARAIVGIEAGCSPTEVGLAVMGRPPEGLVVPWNGVTFHGHAVAQFLDPVQITRLDAKLPRLWPPGPYALGTAAARVAAAMLTSARRPSSVLVVLDGEYGVRHRAAILPSFLSPTGIDRSLTPTLEARDQVRLLTALSQR